MAQQLEPRNTAKDADRLEAEILARALTARLAALRAASQPESLAGADHETAGETAARIERLTDHELRLELFRLKRRLESAEAGEWESANSPKRQAQEALLARYRQLRPAPSPSDGELLDELADAGIAVAEDGLLEVDRITEQVVQLAGQAPELPLAMYHHTSSALTDRFQAEGLKIGKQTNFFNTQQGVYVSTMRAGQPVSVYSRRAARVHGGEPMAVRVRRTLSQVKPDPDDADLDWAQGRQYITPSVPPEDVMWDAEQQPAPAAQAESAARTAHQRAKRGRAPR